jgi:phage baseplate assembly protein gpV
MAANSNSMMYQIGASVKTHVNTEITNAITALKAADNTWTGNNTFAASGKELTMATHNDMAFLFTDANGHIKSDTSVTLVQTTAGSNTKLVCHDLEVDGDITDVAGNVTITGNLTVNGTTTSLQTSNTEIKDSIISLADGAGGADGTGAYANDIGIIFNRGGDGAVKKNPAFFSWDNSESKFLLGITSGTSASTQLTETSRSKLKVGEIEIYDKSTGGATGTYTNAAHYAVLGDLEDFNGGLA